MIKLVSIGSGNVASHLIPHLYKKKVNILQVFSRKLSQAKILASKVEARAIDNLDKIDRTADIYLIQAPDSEIRKISYKLNFVLGNNQIICHCSGSISTSVLTRHPNYGVLYPLQTFTKEVKLNYKEIPFFVTANNVLTEKKLIKISKKFSKKVKTIDDDERKKIHLAAVIVNNFVNHLFVQSEDLMLKENLDFDYLRPLIKETVSKAMRLSPNDLQTGPAVRNDQIVIRKHLRMLSGNKGLKKIYSLLSKEILKKHE